MREMHWLVYVENVNTRKIETYDIFRHGCFPNEVKKAYQKHKWDFDAFAEEVRRSLMYYFWSKCEWEVLVTDLFETKNFQSAKIDVYDQVMLNWDVFIEYVWEMCHARKKPERAKPEEKSKD